MSADRLQMSMVGDAHLRRMFKELPKRVQNKVVRGAIRKAGKLFLSEAKARAPRLTGKTQRYLKLRVRPTRNKAYYRMRVMTGTREELGIAPTDKYYYPSAVEFGHDRAPPHPFMRPAFDTKADEAERVASADIIDGIIREAKAIK